MPKYAFILELFSAAFCSVTTDLTYLVFQAVFGRHKWLLPTSKIQRCPEIMFNP